MIVLVHMSSSAFPDEVLKTPSCCMTLGIILGPAMGRKWRWVDMVLCFLYEYYDKKQTG